MLNENYILKTYNRPECILSAACGKGRSAKVRSKPKHADDKFIAALKANGAMKKSEISFATNLSITAISGVITRLKEKGIVTVILSETCARGVERASYVLSK